jgi:A118 family predicted phage portal protein
MPLPPSGKTPWPPPQLAVPHADMATWHAWYSGDTDHLAQVYGGVGVSTNPTARAFFDLNKPSQYRGGLVGKVARMFWGQPVSPGQPAAKLHVPIAADIAEMSANLMWSDVPRVTVDADSTDKTTAASTSAQLKRYLDDRGHAKMREGSEINSGLGGAYYRVVWDKTIQERPWMDVLYPDAVVPEWRWGRLAAATVWRELEPQTDASEIWRLLERHEPGSIEYGLYRGDIDTLGMQMALSDHPDSEYLVKRVNAQGKQATGISRLLISHTPNILPNRLWHGIPNTEPLGRSDYAGVEPIMDALDESWTSWMRDLRLGKARLLVPQSMLETDGPGSGGVLDLDREVLMQLNMLDEGGDAASIKEVQFDIRVEEHERTCKALRRQILSSAGYSAQSFGDEGTVAVTATEVAARKEESLTTRGLKILYERPGLLERLTTMMMVDVKHCGAKGVDPAAELTASWPDAIQPDPEATARALSLLESAGAISTWMKVRRLNPEWDDTEIAAEVQRIREDKTHAVPAGDPFNARRGRLDEEEDAPAAEDDDEAGADEGLDDEQRGGGSPVEKEAA